MERRVLVTTGTVGFAPKEKFTYEALGISPFQGRISISNGVGHE